MSSNCLGEKLIILSVSRSVHYCRGTSFMEESAKSATARRVSVQQTASETTDELDAVKSLNDELYRQNVPDFFRYCR